MQRPAGVTAIAVIDIIIGALCLILALLAFAGGSFLSGLFASAGAGAGSGIMAGIGAIIGIVILVFAAVFILAGVGLIKVAGWGRILHVIIAVLGILGAVRSFVGGMGGSSLVLNIVFLVYYAWSIWYLFSPGVKGAFGGQPPAQA